MILKEGKDYRRLDPEFKYVTLRRLTLDVSLNLPDVGATGLRGDVHTLPGEIHIGEGFMWDGASSVAVDTPDWMRASLVHDIGYWLIRQGVLEMRWRRKFDREMRRILKADGMPRIRRSWSWLAVRVFARDSAKPRQGEA